jgi:hypothetical protein
MLSLHPLPGITNPKLLNMKVKAKRELDPKITQYDEKTILTFKISAIIMIDFRKKRICK